MAFLDHAPLRPAFGHPHHLAHFQARTFRSGAAARPARRWRLQASSAVCEAPAASPTVQQFSSFEDMVRSSDVPVLVDFHAQWCGPCQMMSSSLGGIADELKGRLSVVKIDTDRYPRLATKYHVRALPTLLLFRDGVAVDRVEGYMAARPLADRVRFYVRGLDKKLGRR